MLKAYVNNEKEYKINTSDLFKILKHWDIQQVSDSYFHAIVDKRSVSIILKNIDKKSKQIVLDIEGQEYTVQIEDKYDLLLKQLGISADQSAMVADIKAPMPGMVLDIMVDQGKSIQKGDAVVILEAMKMENIIKSPGEGIVKKILVKKGDTVEKGEMLIIME